MTSEFKSAGAQVMRPSEKRGLFNVVRLAGIVKYAFRGSDKPEWASPRAYAPQEDETEKPQPWKEKLSRMDTLMRTEALHAAELNIQYFQSATADEIAEKLCVDMDRGLSSSEARSRQTIHGPNELDKDPPPSFWKLLMDQFSDLLVIMLIVAAIVSMALGQYPAATVIIIIVLANAILGVVQESKAGAALDALSSTFEAPTEVLRDGKRQSVESRDLVPGDIVILQTGVKITADIRAIETNSVACNEMPLTGESLPVKKDANWTPDAAAAEEEEEVEEVKSKSPKKKEEKKEAALTAKNILFMGCSVVDGTGKGMVIKTGMNTKMGDIAHLLKTADAGESPLQAKLHSLGVKLGLASIAISVVVFIIGVTTERGTDPADSNPVWLQMMLVAVSLTVAAVPEGLPACVTITLAIGMKEMVKKNALVRNLHSVETLGSASVICTDKTGTLTAGQMTAVRLWFHGDLFRITGVGYTPEGTLEPVKVADESYRKQMSEKSFVNNGPHTLPVKLAVLCSDADIQLVKTTDPKTGQTSEKWDAQGNMSESPLVVAGMKLGINRPEIAAEHKSLHTNTFQSARKMMSRLLDMRKNKGSPIFGGAPYVCTVKGAPNYVLNACTHHVATSAEDESAVQELTQADRDRILADIDDLSSQAYRILAVAYRPYNEMPDTSSATLESNLILAGLFASIDPEREEVGPSIVKARNAGIRTVMITGDYVKTAKAIAENIGLLPRGSPDAKAVDCAVVRKIGDEINELEAKLEELKEAEANKITIAKLQAQVDAVWTNLDAITNYADVYARAKPEDKITIVRSLQRQGNVCSMTGDGVNDAPALKQANIGVAMGTGTDVAKGAADMVLLNDNFCTIVDAIEQGRTIYANITKFVFFLLSTNVSEVFVILIAVIMGLQSPLQPIQILWLNLATDGAPAVALAFEKIEPGVMSEGPRPKEESIIEKVMITGIIIQTFTLTTLVLGTYILGLHMETGTWDGVVSASAFPFVHEGETFANQAELDSFLEDGVKVASSMTIFIITFAELLRAYGSRSLRVSTFTIGFFSNKVMQMAVGISICATFFIGNVPGVMDIFGMRYLDGRQWAWVLIMSFIPITVDEITKYVYRRTNFGFRPKANRDLGGVPSSTSEVSMGQMDHTLRPVTRVKSGGFTALDEPEEKAR